MIACFTVSLFVAGISGLFVICASSAYNLTVGIILNDDDEITMKVSTLAVEMANEELSNINYKLQIKAVNIKENPSFYSIRKACEILEDGIVAIISEIDHVSSKHVSSLCSTFHIPHLVMKCRFPESAENYPMDVRMSPDCNQFANIVYEYVTKVENWRSMVVIHDSNDCILKFENLINQFESKIKMRLWTHNNRMKNKDVMRDLSKTKNDHNFLVDIPYWQIREFMIMASVHNMTGSQYSFIFTDWDANIMDISAFKINNQVNITAFSIIDETAIEKFIKSDTRIESLINSIALIEMSSRKTDISTKILVRMAIIFDSINILTKSLIRLSKWRQLSMEALSCKKNNPWNLGTSLLNAITSTDGLHGVTGKIQFNERNQRTEYNVSIMELTENGFVNSANWRGDKIITIPKIIAPGNSENATLTNPLRVTTKIEIPFVFYGDSQVHSNFDSNPAAWKGYCIDLLQRIGADLGLNFTIHVVADNVYGVSKENETNPDGTEKWSGMIGELMTKKADLAVAPMTITYEREKVVDFTTPFMSLGLSILFLRPKTEAPGLFSFLSPISLPVWLYVISAYVIVSVVIYGISRLTPYERLHSHTCDDIDKKENQFHLLNSLWFSVGALVRQGSDLAPQASSTRIIVGAWWFFTLIIISTYTANLAAFLTVEQLILPIKSAEDLANQTRIKYGTLKGGSSFAFFEKALIPTYKRMYKFMEANPGVLQDDVDTGINRVLNEGGRYAFLMESSWIDYYVQKYCNLMRVGDLLDSKGYGIGFPEGSALRDRMSVSILKLQKEQFLETLKHRWWNEMNITEPCNVKEQGKIPDPLNVSQVGGAFLLLGIGIIIGALISIVELYLRYHFQRTIQKISFSKFINKELIFAMRFTSSSKKLKRINITKNEDKTHSDTAIDTISNRQVLLNRRPSFHDLDNTDVDQNGFCDSSSEGLQYGKYSWSLHNNI